MATVMRSPDQPNDASPTPPRTGRIRASLASAARRMREAVTGKAPETEAPTASTTSEIPPPPHPDTDESRASLRLLAKSLLDEDRTPGEAPPPAARDIGPAPEPAGESVPPPLPRRSSAPPPPLPAAHADAAASAEPPPPATRTQLLRERLAAARTKVAESQARMAAAEAAVVASAAALGIELAADGGEENDELDDQELDDAEDEDATGLEDAELVAADGGDEVEQAELAEAHALLTESEPPSAHSPDDGEEYEDELEPAESNADSAHQS